MFNKYFVQTKNSFYFIEFRRYVVIPFRYSSSLYHVQKYYILGRNKNFFMENPKNLVTFVVQKQFCCIKHRFSLRVWYFIMM